MPIIVAELADASKKLPTIKPRIFLFRLYSAYNRICRIAIKDQIRSKSVIGKGPTFWYHACDKARPALPVKESKTYKVAVSQIKCIKVTHTYSYTILESRSVSW